MRTTLKACKGALFFATLVLGGCINDISEESSVGNVPIRFVAEVNNGKTATRVLDTSFEEGDKIGLFACINGVGLDGERYIDNLLLECEGGSDLLPKESVFYPQGGSSLDFVAYYPYREGALQDGGTMMAVSVSQDQREHSAYSESDFLVASEEGVASSSNPVPLNFRHALSKLEITLIPETEEQLAEMLEDNPKVIACNFYTEAIYDLKECTLNSLSSQADIMAAGDWQESDGKLVGKRVIVVPQSVTPDEQYISIEWRGHIYTCAIEAYELVSNSQRTLQISMSAVNDNELSGVAGSVEDWGEPTIQDETDATLENKAVHLASLSFDASDIYRIYSDGQAVAEICKEYLLTDNVASRAIVAYPMNGQKADLTQGVVLELLDEAGNVHGGSIRWDEGTKQPVYQEGFSEPWRKIYLTADGGIVHDKPADALAVSVSAYVLKDGRDGSNTYPLVKIGTQYWMKENLRAKSYRDGSALSMQTEQGEGISGYYKPDGEEIYFYNGEAILANTLAPRGWRIPTTEDWETLRDYVNNDASLIRAGDWEAPDIEDPVLPCSNLTGFDGYPVGMWHRGEYWNSTKMVGYWTLDNAGTVIPEETVFLMGTVNEIYWNSTISSAGDFYKALSVRCLRDD